MDQSRTHTQFSILEEINPFRHPKRFIFLLGMMVFGRGVTLMCILPPLEGWDEYQHVAYIEHLQEYGRPPVWGQDYIAPQLWTELAKWPQSIFAAAQLQKGQIITYTDYWKQGGHTGVVVQDPKVMIYEAQHPSFYYRLVRPIYAKVGGPKRLLAAISVLRLVNLAFLVAATVLFAGVVRTMCPAMWVQVPVLVSLAVNPMLLLTSVRVANDALAILGAAIVLRLGTWMWSSPQAIRTGRNYLVTSCLLGALTGLAVLCKATNVALLPFSAYCAWVSGRRYTWSKRLSGCFCTMGATGLALFQYVRSNLKTYGVPLPAGEVILNHRAGRTMREYLAAAASLPWSNQLSGWWVSHNFWIGGWSILGAPRSLQNIYQLVIWASLGGWLLRVWYSLIRRKEPAWQPSLSAAPPFLIIGSFSASLAGHAVSSKLAGGIVQTEPWYTAAAIPMLLLIAVGGLRLYPWQKVTRLLCVTLPLVCLVTEAWGLCFVMPKAYTLTRGAEAMHRLALLHPSLLGTATFLMGRTSVVIMAVFIALGSACYFWDFPPTIQQRASPNS
jgi:hypothetical protein